MKFTKIMSLLLTFALVVTAFAMPVDAKEESTEVLAATIGDTDIYVESGTDEATKNAIVASFIGEDDGIEPCGLSCKILGHKYTTSKTYTITHKAKATDPRCLKKYYTVKTCSRCNDTVKTLTSSQYISCCK